jgi:hypothetical protein
MRLQYALTVLFATTTLWSTGCSDDVARPKLPPDTSEEAMLMALHLSGELRPPYKLALDVERDLKYIRSEFSAEYPAVDTLFFKPRWLPSTICVHFDEETAPQVKNGDYRAWDRLNRRLRITEIDLVRFWSNHCALLYFEGTLHARRLEELYRDLPGVANTWTFEGFWCDEQNVYPRLTHAGISYLFSYVWGDCGPLLRRHDYWYFISQNEHPVFVGTWDDRGGAPEPDWWTEAKRNRDQYMEW